MPRNDQGIPVLQCREEVNGRLILTVGLPASGKTSWAREFVRANPRAVRVNRDDLRLMFHEGRFSGSNEKLVTRMQEVMVRSGLEDGRPVVVDDTNLSLAAVARFRRIAEECKTPVQIQSFTNVPLRECIARDAKRDRSVGENVIRTLWERHLMPPPRDRTGKPVCVIVDVDGTLAVNRGRSPYDWGRVSEDAPNTMVVQTVRALAAETPVIVVSGRDGCCREDTAVWLDLHGVPHKELLMRPAGDSRPDWQVKDEILRNDILPRWDPILVVDDRQTVVDMWRAHGLEVWQVAPGRF